ncbi:unnamed protein product [Cochlearia groenlandica]
MEPNIYQLALAALFGASFVAVSGFYMHFKALNLVLERGREKKDNTEEGDSPRNQSQKRRSHVRKKLIDQHGRSPASIPDATPFTGVIDGGGGGGGGSNGQIYVGEIPPGLPRLHTPSEGRSSVHGTSIRKAGSFVRPISPKSPVASASAFESVEESDDDDDNMTGSVGLDGSYLQTNGDMPADATEEQISMAASSMIRSHSVSGDLHGVQPDPITADILRKEPEHETFVRLNVPLEVPTSDEVEAYKCLQECLELRKRYVFQETVAPWEKEVISDPSTPKPNPEPFAHYPQGKSDHYFEMQDGVIHVFPNKDAKEDLFPVADATLFFTDLHHILKVIAAGNMRTLCHRRLVLLEQAKNLIREELISISKFHLVNILFFCVFQKFNLHLMLNADKEFLAQKSAPHRDFYNVRKVDTHVHHSACMNQKHLLRFIKSKLRKEPDEVVIFRDGTYLTLKEVFESLDLTGYDLNVDLLDVHADKSTFHRFDKFNLKYNPCGQSRLREIFLKQDNLIQGRFLGEITKQVISDLEASKYQMAEYRISIYGRKMSEWDQLASWIVNNDLYSENVVWLIQLPRLYNIYKDMGIVTSFQNILDNIFIPLFEATIDPDSHPQLHVFMKQVVGFDLVDDESKPERRPTKHMPTPAQWTNAFNPAFSYYVYYCYANLYVLNKLRESKGMTTITLRPHSGEAGDIDHLAATFLTCHSIAHGINLRKSPVLQYLYYLAQIGLAMSPLSNNSLFLDYHRNPFPVFFLRGLNVSLSTDDPLQIHLTKEPLVEEYSIAASVWKLSACDLCEIARNSVYQSGFSHALKSHWIGKDYYKRGPDGNDIHKTNVPHIRVEFRDTIWKEEMQQVYLGKAVISNEVVP